MPSMPLGVVFFRWYYGEAVKDILVAWRNYLIFSTNYFSVPLLLRTLFAPWRKDITRKPKGLDFKKLFEYVAFNTISRGLGCFVRFTTIIMGVCFLFFVFLCGTLFFILWIFLPIIVLALLVFGIIFLI